MRPTKLLALTLPLLVAGCLGGGMTHGGALDTGNIDPGASKSLTFLSPGDVSIHCHPHPWMESIVTVVEGGPMALTVELLDTLGEDATYRFEPANVTVGIGAVVTYRNVGNFTHTATQVDGAAMHSM